jgi:hypothetical protein
LYIYILQIEIKTRVKSAKKTTIGNVTFINVYVNPSDLNSQCWVYLQSGVFAQLTLANNSNATNYYNNVTNFHAPNVGGQQTTIPIYYNSVTSKPTTLPY